MKYNNLKKMPEEMLPAILLGASVAFAVGYAVQTNPDTDAWWLSATGRIIWEKGFIRENPFCMVEGLKFIIQQPACCLLNYLADRLFGMGGMWIPAVFLNVILLLSAWSALKETGCGPYRRILTLATLEFVVARAGLVTTRPYQLTMSVTFFCISAWIRWSKDGKRDPCGSFFDKNGVRTLAVHAVLTVLQANVQTTSLFFLFLWPACFVVPGAWEIFPDGKEAKTAKTVLKNLKNAAKKSLKVLIPVWITTAAASILNPYGIDGALYLLKAGKAVRDMSDVIVEMKKPQILSVQTLFIVLLAVLAARAMKRRGNPWVVWLSAGSVLLSASYNRNAWILMMAAAVAAGADDFGGNAEETDEKTEKKEEKRTKNDKNRAILLIPAAGFVLGAVIAFQATVPVDEPEAVKFIRNAVAEGKEVRLMTSFGTGGYFERAGITAFVDARLELTSEGICGKAVMEEWFDADVIGADPEGFIEKYGFNYLATTPGTGYLGYFAMHSGEWVLISAEEGVRLYQKIE